MKNCQFQPCYRQSWALLIGINQYRYVNPLALACSDAQSVAQVLLSELGFPKENVFTLIDGQATRAGIMRQFFAFESLSPDDRLFVFFAGHGNTVQGQRGDVGYLVPVDGRVEDKSTLIPWHELMRGAEIIPAKHVLFVMDACYSGLAIQRGHRGGGQRFISDMLQRMSRQVITAGKGDEPVSDGGSSTGRNSVFTGHLLEGLRGGALSDKGVLTASHLMQYVYDRVATDPNSRQTPHYGHLYGDGDFILRTPGNEHLLGTKGEDYLIEVLPDRPEPLPATGLPEITRQVFAEKNGYSEPENEAFGKNEWSQKLGANTCSGLKSELTTASHWLSLVVEPVSNQPVDLDLPRLIKALPNSQKQREHPHDQFRMPSQVITTAKSTIFYDADYSNDGSRAERWKRFVRIEQNGAIEYCEFPAVARLYYTGGTLEDSGMPVKVFFYIQTIGLVCNFLFTAKRILQLGNYDAGIRYLVNLIGAKDTVLAQFAKQPGKDGKSWLDPFDNRSPWSRSVANLKCRDAHLQLEFRMALRTLGEPELKKLIFGCAEQLGLAYNHQSPPRCLNFGTEIFPWEQYSPNLP